MGARRALSNHPFGSDYPEEKCSGSKDCGTHKCTCWYDDPCYVCVHIHRLYPGINGT